MKWKPISRGQERQEKVKHSTTGRPLIYKKNLFSMHQITTAIVPACKINTHTHTNTHACMCMHPHTLSLSQRFSNESAKPLLHITDRGKERIKQRDGGGGG